MATVLRAVPPAPADAVQLPHNLEAEAALLGALMIDNRIAADVMTKLRPEHFFGGEAGLHARLYAAILMLVNKNMVATPVTLRPLFLADPEMQALGGPAYLAELTHSAALIAAPDFAQQIYDLALLRALVSVGREMVGHALDTSTEIDPQKQIEEAEIALYKVAEDGEVSGKHEELWRGGEGRDRHGRGGDQIGRAHLGHHHRAERVEREAGRACIRSDLIILAGRPAMGKTALATNIAFNAARRHVADRADPAGAAVAFFSLEMAADQLAGRVLAEQSGLTSENLRMGRINQAEFRDLARAAAELNDLPLYIDDTPALSIAALRTRARRLKRQKQVGLIVVDYLQLLQGSSRANGDNRVQEVSEISRGLKTLAKELSVPVLALSQLSRAVEQRENKRPQLADLARIGDDRAGRRYRAVRLPRGILPRTAKARRRSQGLRRVDGGGPCDRGARRSDRRQAAPRLDRYRAAALRKGDHALQRSRRGVAPAAALRIGKAARAGLFISPPKRL